MVTEKRPGRSASSRIPTGGCFGEESLRRRCRHQSSTLRRIHDYARWRTILMEMEISLDGGKTFGRYVFPHVTTNTVKKAPGTPTEARHQTICTLE
jgi:hypothetical protein